MFDKKEISQIIAVSLILAFVVNLMESLTGLLKVFIVIFLVIMINVSVKKVTGFKLDAETEIRVWEYDQSQKRPWSLSNLLGIKHKKLFKKPVPLGALLPLLIIVLTQGAVVWMACLVFDVKSAVYRAAKRHNIYKFSEMSDWHIGLIAASGIAANLFFAIIGFLIGSPTFMKFNLLYAFFNILPFSELDGNKIFFGNLLLWTLLAIISTIGLFYALLI